MYNFFGILEDMCVQNIVIKKYKSLTFQFCDLGIDIFSIYMLVIHLDS